LLLYLVFLLLALIFFRGRRLGSVILIFLISLIVVDAGYLFQDVGRPLGSFRFAKASFSRLLPFFPACFRCRCRPPT
jgi:hypothetical protein